MSSQSWPSSNGLNSACPKLPCGLHSLVLNSPAASCSDFGKAVSGAKPVGRKVRGFTPSLLHLRRWRNSAETHGAFVVIRLEVD